MAINFSVNDLVVVNQGYVSITLSQLNSLVAKNATSALGSFGDVVLTVAATGNIDNKSFIRLVPPVGHPKYNNGNGQNVFFTSDDQLNDSLELSNAFFCDYLSKKVLNSTGVTLPKNSIVYQTGFDVTQQLPTVDLASAASSPTAFFFGILEQEIIDGAAGSCLVGGSVVADTSGMVQNDTVFLSNTAGLFNPTSSAGSVSVTLGQVTVVGTSGSFKINASSIPSASGGGGGMQGTTGLQGQTGILGTNGVTGIQGGAGVTGLRGLTGLQGNPGSSGTPGSQGITGLQGPTGILGNTGSQGNTGIQGNTGLAGPAGNTGATGIQGLGVTGLQGLTGLGSDGVTGLQGLTGITGGTGIQGLGVTGLQGLTGLGSDGVTGLQGLTGITGDTGIQGLGVTGLQGLTGLGSDGVTGLQGQTGVDGQTGVQGVTGLGAGSSGNSVSVLTTLTDLNFQAGATTINAYFVEGGTSTVVTSLVVRLLAAGGITTVPTVSAGWSASTTNVFAPTELTGVTSVDDLWTFSSSAKAVVGGSAGATGLLLVGVTGLAGDTGIYAIDVVGYEF